jgi:hypothetical protein
MAADGSSDSDSDRRRDQPLDLPGFPILSNLSTDDPHWRRAILISALLPATAATGARDTRGRTRLGLAIAAVVFSLPALSLALMVSVAVAWEGPAVARSAPPRRRKGNRSRSGYSVAAAGFSRRALFLAGSQPVQDVRDVSWSRQQREVAARQQDGINAEPFLGGGPSPRFRGANLVGADLSQANLLLADLRGASLQEADLRGANVVGARMQDATYDSRTRFPKGLDPEAEGANALATACTLPHHVVNLRFSRAKYPNIATQTRSAISRGWPSIMVLNRPAVRARVERLFSGLDRLDTLDQNQYPPSIGRGRPNGEERGLIRGVDPLGWMADIRAVPSAENRSQGFVLGVRLARFCDGTRFRFVFR